MSPQWQFLRFSSTIGTETSAPLRIIMKHLGIFLVAGVLLAAVVDGRVYYLQNLDGNRYSAGNYPIPEEQSSRDLDLSFSAGESPDTDNPIQSAKKVYTLLSPERQLADVGKPSDRPVYYRLIETPAPKKASQEDIIVLPEKERKLVKINGNNKGEVILELRVIANHDGA